MMAVDTRGQATDLHLAINEVSLLALQTPGPR
jgi:hypothetical protein